MKIPILTYHSIDNSGSVISVSPQKFSSQMELLKIKGFHAIGLDEAIECIRGNKSAPEKSIIITFDDGYQNVYEEAYPVMKKHGFCGTVFLITKYCGGSNLWDRSQSKIPVLDMLTWDEVLEMNSNGFDFGAHTVSHIDLALSGEDKSSAEIVQSKETIEERLGKECMVFAYPYGKTNKKTKEQVQDLFVGACSDELAFATNHSDVYFLPRIEMHYFSTNNFFDWLDTYPFFLYVKSRSLLRQTKKFFK